MIRCVALLRGINVGGHRKLPMTELRALCAELGWADVSTYIQSGNVVFEVDDVAGAGPALAAAIEGRFGYDVPVAVRTAAELAAAAEATPFAAEAADPTKVHLGFLDRDPDPAAVAALPLDRYPPDRYAVIGREVHLHTPDGLGRCRFDSDWLDRQLGARATYRNWKSVRKLLELAA